MLAPKAPASSSRRCDHLPGCAASWNHRPFHDTDDNEPYTTTGVYELDSTCLIP
jgi:hypothetical protein